MQQVPVRGQRPSKPTETPLTEDVLRLRHAEGVAGCAAAGAKGDSCTRVFVRSESAQISFFPEPLARHTAAASQADGQAVTKHPPPQGGRSAVPSPMQALAFGRDRQASAALGLSWPRPPPVNWVAGWRAGAAASSFEGMWLAFQAGRTGIVFHPSRNGGEKHTRSANLTAFSCKAYPGGHLGPGLLSALRGGR